MNAAHEDGTIRHIEASRNISIIQLERAHRLGCSPNSLRPPSCGNRHRRRHIGADTRARQLHVELLLKVQHPG
jgi:hypothetical protein